MPSGRLYCPPLNASENAFSPTRSRYASSPAKTPAIDPSFQSLIATTGCSSSYPGLAGSGFEKSMKLRLRSTFSSVTRVLCAKPQGFCAWKKTTAVSLGRRGLPRSQARCAAEPG